MKSKRGLMFKDLSKQSGFSTANKWVQEIDWIIKFLDADVAVEEQNTITHLNDNPMIIIF